MPGSRVGFCVGNRTLVGALAGIKGYLDYGIFAPAVCCTLITLAFGLFFMRDDALGAEAGEGQP